MVYEIYRNIFVYIYLFLYIDLHTRIDIIGLFYENQYSSTVILSRYKKHPQGSLSSLYIKPFSIRCKATTVSVADVENPGHTSLQVEQFQKDFIT